ncbi:hypothetical protein CASFOL_004118 [Castilleja foliolosa]|uniref:Bifunctional inhibitor/plant lipid transfer protein/seed storage helical domain-containing protein n=1 Tax=Castilleja foliolosa TaxID=1961234 RepID=A0ABD3EJ52_9LAMI
MNTKITSIAICALLVLILTQVEVTKAAGKCNPMQLIVCATAITSRQKPSRACCAKLKQQKPCLCTYMKKPSLKKYIRSPRAQEVARICRISKPKC